MQNIKATKDHLKNHQKYPATKSELMAACNKLSDFSTSDKKEFSQKLADKTYRSADEVIKELGI